MLKKFNVIKFNKIANAVFVMTVVAVQFFVSYRLMKFCIYLNTELENLSGVVRQQNTNLDLLKTMVDALRDELSINHDRTETILLWGGRSFVFILLISFVAIFGFDIFNIYDATDNSTEIAKKVVKLKRY